MNKPLAESAKLAYEYLDSIGEQIFSVGGRDAVTRLNTVKRDLSESLGDTVRYTPCGCISPARCNAYDRCCKND